MSLEHERASYPEHLPAGPELDDLAARLVMNWQTLGDHTWRAEDGWHFDTTEVSGYDTFSPSRTWDDVGDLLDRLAAQGCSVNLLTIGTVPPTYLCHVFSPDSRPLAKAECDSGPLALTRAAVLAWQQRQQGGQP